MCALNSDGLFGVSVLIVSFFYVLHFWIRELRFYKANGWDFTVDSGISMSSGVDDNFRGEKHSNSVRVKIVMPTILVGTLFCIAVFVVKCLVS